MKKRTWVIGGFVLTIVCFFLWIIAAMNYGDDVAAGSYQFKFGQESSTLVLTSDHMFRQTLRIGTDEQHSKGTWIRVGEGGISFSKEFLVVPGDEPEPDGTTFCDMHKAFGLFPSLRLRQYHVLWYGKTGSGDSLTGTYTGDEPGATATLVFTADHRFSQTVVHVGDTHRANGTWKQDSDGTIRFSSAFLKTSGESLGPDELASAMDPRGGNNLQVEISKSAHVMEPVFHKHLMSPWIR
jgi:hypothetical protein